MMNNFVDINEKYNAILEALDRVGIGMDIIDKDYEIVFQNNILKKRFDNSIGIHCYEKYMNLNRPCDFCRIRTVMETNQVEYFELKGADGRIYNLISAPLKNPNGKVDKVAEIIIDITNQKEAENQLKISEEKFRNLFEKSPNAIVLADSSGKITDINHAFEKLFGYPSEELINHNYLELPFYPEHTISTLKEKSEDLVSRGFLEPLELDIIKKDKSIVTVKITASYIKIGDQNYFQVINEDITEKKIAEEKLRESEEKFRHLFEENINGIILVDLKGRIINWNSSIEKDFGYSRDNYIGKSIVEFPGIDIEFIHKIKERLEKYFFGEKLDPIRVKVYKKDGTPAWVNTQASLVDIGKEKNLQIIIEDITDNVHAEQKLKESEEKFRNLFENSLNAIALVDTSGKITDINRAFEKLFGYNSEELINHDYLELPIYPEHTLSTLREKFEEVSKKGYLEPQEFEILKKDKSIVITKTITSYIKIGGQGYYQVINEDITEKKKTEEELKRSEMKYRFITENIADVVSVYDENFKIIYINENQERITGYTPSETYGRNPLEFIHPDDQRKAMQLLRDLYKNSEASGIYRMIHKKGNYLWMDIRAQISRDAENKIRYILISRDITDRIMQQIKLKESEEKYRSLFEQAGDMIAIIDPQTEKFIDFNETIHKILGYTLEELKDLRLFDLNIDDPYSKVKENFEKVLREGSNIFETKIRTKSGEMKYLLNNSKLITLQNKTVIQTIAKDITNQKQVEIKYRSLFEQAGDAIIIVDPQTAKIIDCNKSFYRLLEYTPEEIKEYSLFNLNPYRSQDEAKMLLEEVMRKGTITFESKVRTKSGKIKYILNNSKKIQFLNKTVIQIIGKDITNQKQVEIKYRSLFEQAGDAIMIFDPQTETIIDCNKSFYRLLEFTPEEFKEYNFFNLNPYRSQDEAKKILEEVMRKGTITFESKIRTKSGKIKYMLNNSKKIQFLNKTVIQTIGKDITDLKQAEEKYRILFNEIPLAVFIFDKEGNFIEGNTNLENTISGYSPNLSVGKNFTEILQLFKNYEELLPIFKKRDEYRRLGKKLEPIEFKVVRQDGTERWINWQTTEINLKDKTLIQAIAQDITDRKEAEKLILEENKKLQELNKIRKELITRISHELKTPITSIHGATQALIEMYGKDMSNNVIEFTEIIYRGSKRLKILTEDLLDIMRIESNVFKLNLKEENISEIIKECVNDLKYHAYNREITIYLDLPEEEIIKLDRIRMGQIITNILSNAINNTNPGGKVYINIDKRSEFLDVIIKDTGVGITEQEKSRLFEKFGKIERYGKGDNVYIEGSGLGLYISKEFVKLHGGEIFVESEGRNTGATFTVRLYRNIN